METTTTKAPEVKSKNKAVFIAPIVAGAALFFGIKTYLHSMNYVSTDNAQIETTTLPIVTRVAGYINSVNTTDYSQITQGQILLKIDDSELQLAVKQAQADLLTAEADLSNAKFGLANSSANTSVAKANSDVQKTRLDKAKVDLQRDELLYKDGAITKKQVEDSKANYETTLKLLDANNQQLVLANSQNNSSNALIQKAKALIEVRKVQLEQAQLKLTYTTITSSMNGKIGKLNLEKGQYVQAGQPLMTVVNNDVFWVIANFKETQVAKLKVGQTVEIKIDGYNDTEIKGTIESLSEATGARFSLLPPDNASGNFVKVTQRIPVKIKISNLTDVKSILKAGMSAEVAVNITTAN